MVIIGLGTGRCGTVSLSKHIDKQEGARCSHEGVRLPWVVNEGRFNKAYNKITQGHGEFIEETKNSFKRLSIVGDVSFYNLPYYNLFLERDPETKFIILKRDKDSVIQSYLKKTKGSNHWQSGTTDRKNPWDESYPKFKAKDKADAIGMYYDKYYSMAESIPNAFHMNTEDLNDPDKCIEMLAFCGFSNPTFKKFWANRG